MLLKKPYGWSTLKCIIVYCATSINPLEYGDIDPGFNHQDLSTCEKTEDKGLNNCNNKITKENEHISNLPHFKTIVTSKPNGRLGNNILSYMHLMCVEFNYDVTILTEKAVKNSLDSFFKNFNDIQTVEDDACGYYEFFEQFNKASDNLIIDLLREESGINVTMKRGPDGISISPMQVAIKYGEKINAVMDSYQKQFVQNFEADSKLLPSECKYKVSHNGIDYQMKLAVLIKLGALL